MSDAKGRSPRELYPGWPDSRIKKREKAHDVIEELAANVLRRYRSNSLAEFAEATGVSASTISDLTNGTAWPSALTVARLEVAIEYPLWPKKHLHVPSKNGPTPKPLQK